MKWCISDAEGNVAIEYIDVVKFEAIARGATFVAKFFVRNIPEVLTFNREGVPHDHLEYSWDIWVDIDGNTNVNETEYEDFADYNLAILHYV